jgi:hypothetical protein
MPRTFDVVFIPAAVWDQVTVIPSVETGTDTGTGTGVRPDDPGEYHVVAGAVMSGTLVVEAVAVADQTAQFGALTPSGARSRDGL